MKTSRTKKRQIAYRGIADLVPYARNSRTHSDAQIAQIAESIKEFGWTNPLLIDDDGTIIAGHGRLLAAQLIGMTEAPCITLDGLSSAQKRALIIADNKLALNAGWDEQLLSSELAGLLDEGFDLSLLGFGDDELTALFADKSDGLTDPDDVPDTPADPVTQLGDVWLLGKHRIVCGDSTDAETVAKCLNGTSVELVLRWLLGLAPQVVIWGGNYFANQLPITGCWLVWDKREDTGIENTFADCELAWSNAGGPARVYRQLWNGMIRKGEHGKREHPTQKPVALMEWCIAKTSAGVIFDPYLGSGSTLIACANASLSCLGVEIDPAYVDVAVIRWCEFTGKEATLEATGETFDAVREQRAKVAEAA